jgi:Ni,Fe-hydrogenase III small subunit/formate hydrogenlyase subunit 6/NADH:ubiquinone oxidoreductase subunit I
MLDLLRTRLAQGIATIPVPTSADNGLPARFRGRPRLSPERCPEGCRECAGRAPSELIRLDASDRPGLDLAACLFAPEEAAACPHGAIEFTGDHRMGTGTRSALVTGDGELELVHALGEKMRKLFGRSLRLRSVAAGSCNGCEAELVALGNVVFDLGRFGIQFVASPRHADGIVVTGAVSRNMEDALYRTWEAVPEPRLVIAVGACALSGGPFRGSPEILDGVPGDLPVDLYLPGCPPHPLTILDGMLRLLGRIDGRS